MHQSDAGQTRFALIGWGWRAEFYQRLAALVPSRFALTGVLCRSEQRAEQLRREFGLRATCSLDELLADDPEFVVLSIRRGATAGYLEQLFAAGVPVLTETPPGESVDELRRLWDSAREHQARVQVAEQYPFQPLYTAWLNAVADGLIGEVQNISLSALHGYHGASIIRLALGAGMRPCRVIGKQYTFQVTETFGRGGPVFDGELVDSHRVRLTLEFEGGKVAFFDFSDPAQYHSFIRTRQLNIQGTRGEIDDLGVRYLTSENVPVTQELRRVDRGIYNNQDWSHIGLFLGERQLYVSPLPGARLNDDELAVATCLQRMSRYLATGEEFYSLAEALQDTYLSLLMDQAVRSPEQPVHSRPMPWMS